MATTSSSTTPPTCPAGGSRCESRTRELHVHNGPLGVKVGYYTCARCEWVSAPFTVPEAG